MEKLFFNKNIFASAFFGGNRGYRNYGSYGNSNSGYGGYNNYASYYAKNYGYGMTDYWGCINNYRGRSYYDYNLQSYVCDTSANRYAYGK